MSDIKKNILETIDSIEKQEEGEELLDTLNTIINLMHELGNKRETNATYTRKYKHGKLILTLQYGQE